MSVNLDTNCTVFKLNCLKKIMVQEQDKFDIKAFKSVLDSDFDINYASPDDGNTALHYAILHVFYDNIRKAIVELIISYGANVTQKNCKDLTPLNIITKSFRDSELPLEENKLNLPCGKFSCYNDAIINGLLNVQSQSGDTTNSCTEGISHLHMACMSGNLKAVKFFLDAGCSVNEAIMDDFFLTGLTPLCLAAINRDKDMVRLLLQYGADFKYINPKGLSPLHVIIDKPVDPRSESDVKESLENDNFLDFVLNLDSSDLNPVDCIGMSHFHVHCTKRNNFQEIEKTLNKLLNAGVDIDAHINFDSPIWPGYSALHFAAGCNLETLEFLLKNKANFFAKDAHGRTPLDFCLKKYKLSSFIPILKSQEVLGSIEFQNGVWVVDVLCALVSEDKLREYLKNFDVNAVIPFDSPLWPGFTVLHLAVLVTNDYNFLKICLDCGANLKIQDANGMSPLHLAVHMIKYDCYFYYKALIAYDDGSTNVVDRYGLSHFHIACLIDDLEAVKKFLGKGLNVNTPLQKDIKFPASETTDLFLGIYYKTIKNGSMPLHLAVGKSLYALAKLLICQNAVDDPHILNGNGLTWIHNIFLKVSWISDEWKTLLCLHPQSLKSNPSAPGGLSHFHVACYAGHLEAVEALLPFVADINEPITNELVKCVHYLPRKLCVGDTALHFAARSRSIETVDLLLKNGADIRVKNVKGCTPLHIFLIRIFQDPNLTITCLNFAQYLALMCENKEMWPDDLKSIRLHVACALGDQMWMKKLLESGENVNKRIDSNSLIWPGETPLHILIKKRKYRWEDPEVKLLIEYGADFGTILLNSNLDCGVYRCWRFPLQVIQNLIPVADQDGFSVFHESCAIGEYEIVEKFILSGVDIHAPVSYMAKDNAGYTALHFAVRLSSENVVALLLKYGANVNLGDAEGNTPVHLAARYEYHLLLKFFLRATVFNIETLNIYGETVMDLLSENYTLTIDIVTYCLKHASKIRNIEFFIKIVARTAFKFFESAYELIIDCIPISIADLDSNGRNVIHHLISIGHDIITSDLMDKYEKLHSNIESLLKRGCELDLQDNEGRTPLHYAALSSDPNKIRGLLWAGADVNIMDIHGNTPYSLCYKFVRYFDEYICRFKAVGFYLNPVNEKRWQEKENPVQESNLQEKCLEMEEVSITEWITLRDILTDKMVMRYPLMSLQQRRAICRYFDSDQLNEMSCSLKALFKLQQRRILKREQLFKSAVIALDVLLNSCLPKHCLESILINFSNEEMLSLTRCKK